MRPKILLTHNNQTKSLAEWTEQLGLGDWTLYKRRRAGRPIEEILSPIPLWTRPDSLRTKARKAGIPYKTVHRRIALGWTEERALSEPVHYRGQKQRG